MLRQLLSRLVQRRRGATVAGPGDDPFRQAEKFAQARELNAALECYRACLRDAPRRLDAHLGAANTLVDLWALDEAVAAYGRALELAPRSSVIYSALLFHHHYRSPPDPHHLYELHRSYGKLMRGAAGGGQLKFAPTPDQARRLRIGYMSPNFSRHPVGYFVESVLRCHDRTQHEIYCYYAHRLADDATARMRALADGWRDIAAVDDAALENIVRGDTIDILVDLAGHSKGNRLGVFARRPAPVQMTWLGYPDTTGLEVVDFRITDAVADLAPAAEGRHVERLLRIDGAFLCYQPPADTPPVAPRDGAPEGIVFSLFNNIAKINEQTLATWARILTAVPESRLILKSAQLDYPDTVDRVLDCCERHGIGAACIELRGWIKDCCGHLASYDGVDIALDTFPYNGTTTTCEALWMGMPVVSLAGDVHMSRIGATILHCTGLDDLVARSSGEYADIAIALARDQYRRRTLRATLRDRLQASPLLDHAGFTRKLEHHYRQSWSEWCAGQRVA